MSLTHAYRICDLALASNIPLPELTPAETLRAECKFELLPPGPPAPGDFAWFHQWLSDDSDGETADGTHDESKRVWAYFARTNDGYLLRFPSCGDFLLSADAAEIRFCPLPGTPDVTIRHLLLDQVIPLVLSRRGRVVLHASAVQTAHGVIAFAGKSGQGKSTLAASFAQNGCALLSDDCLVLRREKGRWIALPSYPGVRLWPSAANELLQDRLSQKDTLTVEVAHYTSKRRVSESEVLPFAKSPGPVRRLFVLADDTPTSALQRLPAARAFMALIESAYNLDITDTAFLRRQFEALGQLTEDVPAYAIHYPREFASLPALRQTILSHLQENADEDNENK
jgi:hypothetical protein